MSVMNFSAADCKSDHFVSLYMLYTMYGISIVNLVSICHEGKNIFLTSI
jgi:hypothetical protein